MQQEWDPVDEEVDEHQAHEKREAEENAADREAISEKR
jgi:hypothetical protein